MNFQLIFVFLASACGIACGSGGRGPTFTPAEREISSSNTAKAEETWPTPPGALVASPVELRVAANDPRFRLLERPEIRASTVMVLPRTTMPIALYALLDAWLSDDSAPTEPDVRQQPCAIGSICLTVVSEEMAALKQRLERGVLADSDGLGRALLKARAQWIEAKSQPHGLAELILSAGAASEGYLSLRESNQPELGAALQSILDQSKICLVLPDRSALASTEWTVAPSEPTTTGQRATDPSSDAPALRFLIREMETPLIAWSIRADDDPSKRRVDAWIAELVLSSFKKRAPAITWKKLRSVAGAHSLVDALGLITTIQELQRGPAPRKEDFSAQELRGIENRARLARADFGACEPFEFGHENALDYRVEWLIIGPASLARSLQAAGTAFVEVHTP